MNAIPQKPAVLDERGVSLLETLFTVSILSILISAAVLHGSSMYRNAILEYETQMIVSDLKLLQAISRTATYDQTDFPQKEKPPMVPSMEFYSDSYRIRPIILGGKTIRSHDVAPNIGMSLTNTEYISFQTNGDTRFRRMGNIHLFCRGRGKFARKIVIDTAGRIRIERYSP